MRAAAGPAGGPSISSTRFPGQVYGGTRGAYHCPDRLHSSVRHTGPAPVELREDQLDDPLRFRWITRQKVGHGLDERTFPLRHSGVLLIADRRHASPPLIVRCSCNRAGNPPTSSSLADDEACLLAPPQHGGARFTDTRSAFDCALLVQSIPTLASRFLIVSPAVRPERCDGSWMILTSGAKIGLWQHFVAMWR
jgi:hypothetical protein